MASDDFCCNRLPVLRAGPVTMEFDATSGLLRYLRIGDYEILRGIYVAVRDRNWGTVRPTLKDLCVDQSTDAFHVSVSVQCQQREIDFEWRGEIVGTAQGTVEYTMDGVARSTFLRNRIGFCVLHGSDTCAGRDCVIEHVDGSQELAAFPREIAPHQPFMDVRAMQHPVCEGLKARVEFEGDVFETEDQRNWTDASFKTYCTPLAMPFPVEIAQGTMVKQRVRIELVDTRPAPDRVESAPVVAISPPIALRWGEECTIPRMGLGVASHGGPLSPTARARLAILKLDHLRVDLALDHPDFIQLLAAAKEQAEQVGASLQMALTADMELLDRLPELAEAVEQTAAPITAWLVYGCREPSTPPALFQSVRTALQAITADAAFAMGTNANFAELNRRRPPAGMADWVCYSINPQVHVFDDDSLFETLDAQRETVVSAKHFAGGSKVAVSPVTLKPRFNAVATGAEPAAPPGELPPQVDPRQAELLAASWTLGSIAALAAGGAESATYFETTGWRGVMELDEGCAAPERFPSRAGCVFPTYHVLADLAGLSHSQIRTLKVERPRTLAGIAVTDNTRGMILLANLTPESVVVDVPKVWDRHSATSIRMLGQACLGDAMKRPEKYRAQSPRGFRGGRVNLPARAYVRIDYGG
ncbi:MAG: hypothetical protein ACOY3P_16570 [Planctomycetota bacterium]